VNLTAANTAIVLDSTADFPEGPARFPNIRIVPLYVRFGTESLADYAELGPEEFYERLRSAPAPPTTSQPTPGDFVAVYEELAPRYERVLSLQLSSTLSGTFASAGAAAATLGADGVGVRVIDTRTVSAAIAMLALAVQRRLERGTTDEEVDALVERYRREHGLLFTVDTLEYLAKGGRIGRAAALAGSLLDVKPILTLDDGEVVPLKRVRGQARALAEFRAIFEARSADAPSLHVGIAHAAAPERLEAVRRLVAETRPQAVVDVATTLGAVVGTHAGPGTVGFFWFDDPD
jgi:DegV family protein with EDD domain